MMETTDNDTETCINTGTEEELSLVNRPITTQETNDVICQISGVKDGEDEDDCIRRNSSQRVSQSISDENKTDEEDRIPDGGWGWIVVFGASLVLVLVDVIGQCFGIVFSTFLLDLGTSSVMTAWIFNMFGFLWCLTGPPLSPLIKEFGWRRVTFVASFLLAGSTISSAFVTSAWVLFFTYSALGGIACGLLSNISYMIVPHYFTTRRGLASGIIMMWDCGGQLLGSPLVKLLQDEYTYKGATLILGGVVLNCCVGAAVFHPVEWHLKPKGVLAEPTVARSASGALEGGLARRSNSPRPTTRTLVRRIAQSTLEDLRILSSARAAIIAVGATVIFNGYLNFLAFVPFAMQEAGHSLGDAAACVSVSAVCNMLTRITVASLSDTKMFSFRVCYMLGGLTITASMLTFTLLTDMVWIRVTMGVWGCGVGAFMSIFNLVMVHYMGLDRFMPMLGATMLFIASGYLTIGPLAGYIRDTTGSYNVAIWMLAATVFSSCLLWLFMPAAEIYDSTRGLQKCRGKRTV
ncbi:monocarboxylate transporter 12-B-like [Penaeus chinensis]|uniref:monocarboxylate transporter 12-B-like n=1 Tax=Penaeus chinensis TaxID=139456 RepID=UPI001FB654F3|nr:monocarboxylate transporter 12-B-like [Penaeus chinensis]XP_047488199.1 monocarboxylate transporter 12-B-like [Penaeus chinensis]